MKDIRNKSVFILVGMPGSGKSTLAKKLAKRFGAFHLSSDEIREELFNSTRYGIEGHEAVNKLREKAHSILYNRALNFLSDGGKVIIDATHLDPKKRKIAIDTLSKTVDRNKMCFAVVSTSVETIENRMKARVKEAANNSENLFQGWKRVTKYFLNEFESGKLTWPEESEELDLFDHREIEYVLAE